MSTENQIKLSTGTWPFQEVLPHDWADYFRTAGPAPEEPYDEKEVLGDVMERITPPDDDPRWKVYHDALGAANELLQRFEWLCAFAPVDVPEDWVLSPGIALALSIETIGKDDLRGRKLQYIRHTILGTREDISEVSRLAAGLISKEERHAGGEKFPDPAGKEEGEVGPAEPNPSGSS